jgi:hypothetical protein
MHDVPSIVNAAGKGKPEPTKFVKYNTRCVGHLHAQTNTNNVNNS